MPTLSIIVPIYNVEKYLHSCLDSILAQTYTNFELILVNDGSKDNCGIICEKYAIKDRRIKVLHKENGGVSSARNMGIDIAKGEYITFVDPDDTVEPNMYEVLLQTATKLNVDMVICPIRTLNLNTNTISVSSYIEETDCLIDKKKIETFLIPSIIIDKTYSLVSVINKVYKRRLFENPILRFDDTKHFAEDARINYTLLTLINNLAYVEKPLYNYFIHKRDSLSQIFREDLYDYALDNKNFLIDLCKKNHLENLIDSVRIHYTSTTLGYLQDVVNQDIHDKTKIRILSTILNDKEFIEDLHVYKSTTIFGMALKYICVLKNEILFINFIKIKNRIRPYVKKVY